MLEYLLHYIPLLISGDFAITSFIYRLTGHYHHVFSYPHI